MSSAVDLIIESTLRGDVALSAALATDPRTGKAAIFKGSKNQAPLINPTITFREANNNPIAKLAGTADQEIYDFEIWTADRGGSSVQVIFELMDPLLHLQRLVPLDPTTGRFWETLRICGSAPDLYDSNLKEWYGLYRYQFLHRRY